MFTVCPFAYVLWDFVGSQFGFTISQNCDVVILFLKAMDIGMSSYVMNLWLSALISIFFSIIWFARNQAFHHDFHFPISMALVLVASSIRDDNRSQMGVMSNSVDDLLRFLRLGITYLEETLL